MSCKRVLVSSRMQLTAFWCKVKKPDIILLSLSITSVVSNCSLQQYRSVGAFFLTKGFGSGAAALGSS